jgi:sugar diacid utilization regulator
MTDFDAELIVCLANHNLRAGPAAKKLYMARNSVVYHAKKIKEETGKDPFNFYDMCWLLPRAKAALGEYGCFVTDGGSNND